MENLSIFLFENNALSLLQRKESLQLNMVLFMALQMLKSTFFLAAFLIANSFTDCENYCQTKNYCCVQTDGSVFSLSIPIYIHMYVCQASYAYSWLPWSSLFIYLLGFFFVFFVRGKIFHISWPVPPFPGSIYTERERERKHDRQTFENIYWRGFQLIGLQLFSGHISNATTASLMKKPELFVMNIPK